MATRSARLTTLLLTLSISTALSLRSAPLPADPPRAKPAKKDAKKKAETKADAESRRGQTLYKQKKYAEAAKHFQMAADAYQKRNDAVGAAWMYSWKGDCHRDAKDDGAAVAAFTESFRRFAQLKDLNGLAVTAGDLGKAPGAMLSTRSGVSMRGGREHSACSPAYRRESMAPGGSEVLIRTRDGRRRPRENGECGRG